MPDADADVLVIGGGAAGLAAADALAAAGRRVRLLEARRRLGGRIRTVRPAAFPLPVELGAEFVHGEPAATLALLRRFRLPFAPSDGRSVHFEGGRLCSRPDFFESVGRVMDRLDRLPRGEDLAFEDFLEEHAAGPELADARRRARAFVAGFDAADPARISARALEAEWGALGDVSEEPQYRLLDGYGALVRALARALPPGRVRVETGARVTRLRWRRGHVEVATRLAGGGGATFTARQAVVTLPLPFLQMEPGARGAVAFEPDLPGKREAARRLHMGGVVKVVLAFDAAFWERVKGEAGEALADLAFLLVPGAPFPTFWTAHPLRAPVLTAWAGGPAADALSGRPSSALVRTALDVLAGATSRRRGDLTRRLVAARVADWPRDPLARGAYSYVGVGGRGAQAALAAPVEGTLFFAGEATDTSGQASTVAGALASGTRAAAAALAAT